MHTRGVNCLTPRNMNSTTTCQYTGKTCGYGTCTLPTHYWNFATQTCSTIYPPNSSSTVNIENMQNLVDSLTLGFAFTLFVLGAILWTKIARPLL